MYPGWWGLEIWISSPPPPVLLKVRPEAGRRSEHGNIDRLCPGRDAPLDAVGWEKLSLPEGLGLGPILAQPCPKNPRNSGLLDQGKQHVFQRRTGRRETAVQLGLLTIYDMCKAVDRGMVIGGIRLIEKRGGKSGHWLAESEA